LHYSPAKAIILYDLLYHAYLVALELDLCGSRIASRSDFLNVGALDIFLPQPSIFTPETVVVRAVKLSLSASATGAATAHPLWVNRSGQHLSANLR
jgi:hypothetical protein